ncbi:type II secretion system F family protein [Methanocaldococcus infernus]
MKYLELIYKRVIKRNLLIFKKLGKSFDEKKFFLMLAFSIIIPIILSRLLNLSFKSTIIMTLLYFGATLSLPSILYESKMEKLEENLPKALYIIVLALDSGRSINEALHEVVRANIKEVSPVFARVLYLIEKQKLSFEEAMTVVSTFYNSKILRMLGKIMIENRKFGGNLSETLKTLAKTLEDFRLYKRQLMSVTANSLAMGFIMICLVVPGVAALLASYLMVLGKTLPGVGNIPQINPEDIKRCLDVIQMGSVVVGALFSVPLFGFKINRMLLISAITMTGSMLVFYLMITIGPMLFSQ